MSTAFSNACIHCIPYVWCNRVKGFCSDILSGQFTLFQFLKCMWIVFVHILLQKLPEIQIQWWWIWESRRLQVSGNDTSIKEHSQRVLCWVCCMCCSLTLLKPAVFFVSFDKGNESHNKYLAGNIEQLLPLKKMGSCHVSRDSTPRFDI